MPATPARAETPGGGTPRRRRRAVRGGGVPYAAATRRRAPAIESAGRRGPGAARPGGATISSTYVVWTLAAFVMTALWAVVIIVNKRTLEYISPLALNFFLRGVSAIGLVALTVPLTVFGLWPNGFGTDWAAAGYIAVSSVVTWLIAFSTYYYALRVGRVSVVAPIASTDPVWTALFAFAILGAAIGAPTLLGLLVVMTGVVLISRWMEDEPDVTVDALSGPAFEPGVAAPWSSSSRSSP
ncbi:MAG TPA: DMT family transporter, partial [Thermoleophilia bacterium]|nr:DMT family transporter [Thermoleophilia bacterium]